MKIKLEAKRPRWKKKSKEKAPHLVLVHQVLKLKLFTKSYAIFHSDIIKVAVLNLIFLYFIFLLCYYPKWNFITESLKKLQDELSLIQNLFPVWHIFVTDGKQT